MEKVNNPYWQRIEEVLFWANMTANSLARHIGLSRSENLYQIKRGNNRISHALADRIVSAFPQISRAWLITGEGTMLVRPKEPHAIPYYDIDLMDYIRELHRMRPDNVLDAPMVRESDFAILYGGRDMAPLTPKDSVVILKKVTTDDIRPGGEYVIVTKDMVSLRLVRHDTNELCWRLMSADRELYEDIVVPNEDVMAVYVVRGKVIPTRY